MGPRDLAHLARITEMGLEPFHLDSLKEEVKDLDICINTIPYLVLTAGIIAGMPTNTLIIDLASKPGGTDFTRWNGFSLRYAEKRGVKALLAPSLPGIVAPKTAGQILANILSQLLSEDFEMREENL